MLPSRATALFDRVARVGLGLLLVSLVFVGPKSAYGWVGVLLVVSAFGRWNHAEGERPS